MSKQRTFVAAVAGCMAAVVFASPAVAFEAYKGTPNVHRRVTAAALACDAPAPVDDCFQPAAIRALVGTGSLLGGTDLNDTLYGISIFNPAEHCDGADYLPLHGYWNSRGAATFMLRLCRNAARSHVLAAISEANTLVDAVGRPATPGPLPADPGEGGCFGRIISASTPHPPWAARCAVLGDFGRMLHVVQDFYAHSNWSDSAESGRPVGLNRTGPSYLFDFLHDSSMPAPPKELSTGCAALSTAVACPPAVRVTWGYKRILGVRVRYPKITFISRVTHGDLNKDSGHWNGYEPGRGTTHRGKEQGNFARAVHAAAAETRVQWVRFKHALADKYGSTRSTAMICMLTRDNSSTCFPSTVPGADQTTLPTSDSTPPAAQITLRRDGIGDLIVTTTAVSDWSLRSTIHVDATGIDGEGVRRVSLSATYRVTCVPAGATNNSNQRVIEVHAAPSESIQYREPGQLVDTRRTVTRDDDLTVAFPSCPDGFFNWSRPEVAYVAEGENFYGGVMTSATLTLKRGSPPT